MTIIEFEEERSIRPCLHCGELGMDTRRNINNNGLQVVCPHCGSARPWGALLYLKQNEHKRASRPPLPNGETLDSIWAEYGDCCVICSAPKHFLVTLGIGRNVHHVLPYAQHGHQGPWIPICTHCHAVVNERQRVYWFIQRVVLKSGTAAEPEQTTGEEERHGLPPAA